jgi:integrase
MTPWTPHDLRRTARTVMARIGIPDEYAEEVLNHSKVGIKKVYNTY